MDAFRGSLSGKENGHRSGSVAEAAAVRERKASVLNEEKGYTIGEAADVYGDVAEAEQYGYVSRGLKSRHIQFIALGGSWK